MKINGLKYQDCEACGDTVPSRSLRRISELRLLNTGIRFVSGGSLLCPTCRLAVERAEKHERGHEDDPHDHAGCSECISDGIGNARPL